MAGWVVEAGLAAACVEQHLLSSLPGVSPTGEGAEPSATGEGEGADSAPAVAA